MEGDDEFDDIEWEVDPDEEEQLDEASSQEGRDHCVPAPRLQDEDGEETEEEEPEEEDAVISFEFDLSGKKRDIDAANDDLVGGNPNAVGKKKARRIRNLTSEHAYEISLERCKASLQQALLWVDQVVTWSSNEVMSSIMLSLLPLSISASETSSAIGKLETIVQWMKTTFTMLSYDDMTEEEGRDGSAYQDLLDVVLEKRVGSAIQLNQLFFMLLQALGYRCRFVFSIDPQSCDPYQHEDLYDFFVKSTDSKSAAAIDLTVEKKVSTVQKGRSAEERFALDAWLEVWLCPEVKDSNVNKAALQHRWVVVDSVRPIFNRFEAIEKVLRKGKAVQYVVAAEVFTHLETAQNVLLNVTSTYSFRRVSTTKTLAQVEALCRSWFEHHLDRANQKVLACGQKKADSVSSSSSFSSAKKAVFTMELVDLLDDDDDMPASASSSSANTNSAHLAASCRSNSSQSTQQPPIDVDVEEVAAQPDIAQVVALEKFHIQQVGSRQALTAMPQTFAEFKDHPHYLLERHLLSEEMLHPHDKKVVGMFKGEAVYLQSMKCKLRSKLQWRRQQRVVLKGATPVKTIKRRLRDKTQSQQDGLVLTKEAKEFGLYGEWQTSPWVVPAIEDGVLPMNKHGNFEVWDGLAHYVPNGAVYVASGTAVKAAKSIGINYVPAVVGFEHKGMYTVPKIGGVVVLQQDAGMLRDVIFTMEAMKEEKDYEKMEAKIAMKWEKLTRLLLARNYVLVQYGV